MKRLWLKLLGASVITLLVGWIVPAHTASLSNENSRMIVAMGEGMTGGGMMGSYGPNGSYNGNPQQDSAELDSPAGRLYAQTCTRCHALPNPRQHTGEQWPGVVARMEQHMRDARQPLPGKRDITDIDRFLTQHASGGR